MSAIQKAYKRWRKEAGGDHRQTRIEHENALAAFRAGWRASYGEKLDRPPRTLEEAERAAQYAGRGVAEHCPDGWGFLVLMATFGAGGDMTYVSNVEREDASAMLEELLGKWRGGGDPADDKSPKMGGTASCQLREVAELLALICATFTSPGMEVGLNRLGMEVAGVVDFDDAKQIADAQVKSVAGIRQLMGRAMVLTQRYVPELFDHLKLGG